MPVREAQPRKGGFGSDRANDRSRRRGSLKARTKTVSRDPVAAEKTQQE